MTCECWNAATGGCYTMLAEHTSWIEGLLLQPRRLAARLSEQGQYPQDLGHRAMGRARHAGRPLLLGMGLCLRPRPLGSRLGRGRRHPPAVGPERGHGHGGDPPHQSRP